MDTSKLRLYNPDWQIGNNKVRQLNYASKLRLINYGHRIRSNKFKLTLTD